MSGPYRLYPTAHGWWSFQDYATLLGIVQRIRPATVLDFGPGGSTLAIVEGGAAHVESFEDDEHWVTAYRARFVGLPITLRAYTHADPLVIPEIGSRRFDFACVDGPRNTSTRGVEIRFALERCPWVALHDALSEPLVAAMQEAADSGRSVEMIHYDRNPCEPHAIGLIGPAQ